MQQDESKQSCNPSATHLGHDQNTVLAIRIWDPGLMQKTMTEHCPTKTKYYLHKTLVETENASASQHTVQAACTTARYHNDDHNGREHRDDDHEHRDDQDQDRQDHQDDHDHHTTTTTTTNTTVNKTTHISRTTRSRRPRQPRSWRQDGKHLQIVALEYWTD